MSDVSLADIGQRLSEARENQHISLEQAERETRIRMKYLMAMEAGDFEALPNPVVARGFLRSYARYLGLDPEPLVDALQQALPESAPFTRLPRREGPHVLDMDLGRPASSGVTPILSALLVILLVGVAGYWLWLQGYITAPFLSPRLTQEVSTPVPPPSPTPSPSVITALPSDTPAPTSQPAVVPPATNTPTSTPQAAPATPVPTPTSPPSPTPTERRKVVLATPTPTSTPANLLVVKAVLVDRTWLRALVDGQLVDEGLYDAGQEFTWEGQVVEIRTGNAGGMQLTVNDKDLGILGAKGEVQHWIFYLRDGEIVRVTPTPTPVPAKG